MLTNAERNLLDKIAAKTKMDCWFSLIEKEDGSFEAFDLEENEPMRLTDAIELLLEGVENIENFETCKLTKKEESLLKGVASRFGIAFDIPERTLRAVALHPYYKAAEITIENTLKAKQDFVGGFIEAVYPFEDRVAIICNEESKIEGLPMNRSLYSEDGELYDILCGPCLIVGCGNHDFCSLTDEQADKYIKKFLYPQRLIELPNGTLVIKDTEAPDFPENKNKGE